MTRIPPPRGMPTCAWVRSTEGSSAGAVRTILSTTIVGWAVSGGLRGGAWESVGARRTVEIAVAACVEADAEMRRTNLRQSPGRSRSKV